MPQSSASIPAKPTFGTLKEKISQGDYINRKKGKNIFCTTPKICNKPLKNSSYAMIHSFNLGRNLKIYRNVVANNKYNLVIGQYTKSNLKNVCTISNGPPPTDYSNPCATSPCTCPCTCVCNNTCPCNCNSKPCTCICTCPCTCVCTCPCDCNNIVEIDASEKACPFYWNHTIDPIGELFGSSQCGDFNYVKYMRFKPL